MSKKVYVVGCECNDNGWDFGSHSFTLPEHAIQLMRDYVAKFIRHRRSEGKEVKDLYVWRDTVMEDASEKSQTITFNVGGDFYDFRVWAINLHSERIPAKKVINY